MFNIDVDLLKLRVLVEEIFLKNNYKALWLLEKIQGLWFFLGKNYKAYPDVILGGKPCIFSQQNHKR